MSKIQEIFEYIKPDLQKTDQLILEFSAGKSPLIKEISNHLILSGGKRIRPILLILASKLCDEEFKNYHNLAAAIELIHSATLLHDDVVDNSDIRRGKKTANAIWDNKASILVGDFVFAVSFQLMVKSNNLKVLDLLAKTSSIMADGEVMQLENSSDVKISLKTYFEIIFGKTAALFSAACEASALNCNQSEEKTVALKNFGKDLGILFQIVDDILDYAPNSKIDKNIGDDFFEGKVTLPIIKTYESASDPDKKTIENLFLQNLESKENKQENLDEILQLIKKYQGIEKSYDLAMKYQESAKNSLAIFPDSIYKNYMLEILNYCISRLK